jgi:hypothetical protein
MSMKAALKYWRKGLGSGRSENRNAACVSKTQAAFRKKAGRQESASECAKIAHQECKIVREKILPRSLI